MSDNSLSCFYCVYLLMHKFAQFAEYIYICIAIGPVAQLNRVADSGSDGRGFESHPGHDIQNEDL